MWELVFNPPKHDAWAVDVTAKCSHCGEPMFCNPAVLGWGNDDHGTILWSGFITNYKEFPERSKWFAFDAAEYVRDKLPKYCAKCGEQMNFVEVT